MKITRAHIENIKTRVQDSTNIYPQMISVNTKSNVEERINRLENAMIRHEDVIEDISHPSFAKHHQNEHNWDEYTNEFSSILKDLDWRVKSLEFNDQHEENKLFRNQVIADFNSLKKAVSEDIINLNLKINDISSKLSEVLLNKNKTYIIKRAEQPSNRPTKSLKKVNFNIDFSQQNVDSEFENDANNSRSFLNSSSDNTVMIRPRRNLDSSLPNINQISREKVRSARGRYLQNRSFDNDGNRHPIVRDLTPVAEMINKEDYLNVEETDDNQNVLRIRGRSAYMNRPKRLTNELNPYVKSCRHKKNYSFDIITE